MTINYIKWLVENRKKTSAKYKIFINSLIHKHNYKNLVEWYKFLEDLGVDGWRFTTGRISGFLKENADQIKIYSKDCFDEYLDLINMAINKYKNKEKLMYLNIENFFTTTSLKSKKRYIFDENLCICDYKKNACSIDPYGNVQFCTGWQCQKYGNVFETPIEKIWLSDKMRKMKDFKIKEITECQGCKYLKYCGGGCRIEAKDIYSKDLTVCENFELFENLIVPILKANDIELLV